MEELKRVRYDIVLLDLKLPGMSGMEACRAMRADPAFCRIPIVMLTASGSQVSKAKGLDIGADDYIVKPFQPSRVLESIERISKK